MVRLKKLFTIQYGMHEINSKGNLDNGDTPVISSQGTDNGCYGFFDVEAKFDKAVISVPRTGSVGAAFVQLHLCSIDDNCLVLIPKRKLKTEYLFYIAQVIRNEKWRYMYGRQITPKRIENLEVMREDKLKYQFSYNSILKNTEKEKQYLIRKLEKLLQDHKYGNDNSFTGYKEVPLTTLFKGTNAKSKGFKNYENGKIPFISNGFADNGFVGFVTPNKNDRVFDKDSICISAFCEATVQKAPFLPRGNGGSGLISLITINTNDFRGANFSRFIY